MIPRRAPYVQHIVGNGAAAGILRNYAVVGNQQSCGAVAGGPFGFTARRPLAAVGDDHQDLSGAAGGHGVQRGLQGVGAGPEGVRNVGGENVQPQV